MDIDISHLDLNGLITLQTQIRRELKETHRWIDKTAERPDWDSYYLFMAYAASLRGSCTRRQVGALIVSQDHSLISTGFNGKGAGLVNCLHSPCEGAFGSSGQGLDQCEAIHAEVNALLRFPDKTKVHSVYVTCSPCTHCVDILLGTNACRIVFAEEYAHNVEAKRRWVKAGRQWVHYKPSSGKSKELVDSIPSKESSCSGSCPHDTKPVQVEKNNNTSPLPTPGTPLSVFLGLSKPRRPDQEN